MSQLTRTVLLLALILGLWSSQSSGAFFSRSQEIPAEARAAEPSGSWFWTGMYTRIYNRIWSSPSPSPIAQTASSTTPSPDSIFSSLEEVRNCTGLQNRTRSMVARLAKSPLTAIQAAQNSALLRVFSTLTGNYGRFNSTLSGLSSALNSLASKMNCTNLVPFFEEIQKIEANTTAIV